MPHSLLACFVVFVYFPHLFFFFFFGYVFRCHVWFSSAHARTHERHVTARTATTPSTITTFFSNEYQSRDVLFGFYLHMLARTIFVFANQVVVAIADGSNLSLFMNNMSFKE